MGIWRTRKETDENGKRHSREIEQNYLEVVRGVKEEHRSFLTEYIIQWGRFMRSYCQNSDPEKKYTRFDSYDLRDFLFVGMKQRLSLSAEAFDHDPDGMRALEKAMNDIETAMIKCMSEHYKKYQFGSYPPAPEQDLTPHIPGEEWKPQYNSIHLLEYSQNHLLVIGPLILQWEESYGKTCYSVYALNGYLLFKLEEVRNGALRRFKDPWKRHILAIERVQEIARMTDWEHIETFLYKQKRLLGKEVLQKSSIPLV